MRREGEKFSLPLASHRDGKFRHEGERERGRISLPLLSPPLATEIPSRERERERERERKREREKEGKKEREKFHFIIKQNYILDKSKSLNVHKMILNYEKSRISFKT